MNLILTSFKISLLVLGGLLRIIQIHFIHTCVCKYQMSVFASSVTNIYTHTVVICIIVYITIYPYCLISQPYLYVKLSPAPPFQ